MKLTSLSFTILLTIIITLFDTKIVSAQTEAEQIFQRIIGEIYEDSETGYDYSELYDKLTYYYNNKINLNNTTAEELSDLFFLTEIQIQAIMDYRKRFRNFYSIYELSTIDVIDIQTIQNLLYFIKIEPTESKKRNSNYFLPLYGNYFQIRTERIYNYEKSILQGNEYPGNPFKLYLRYYHQPDRLLSYGITMEKDAGEEFFKGSQKYGFDFYSAHFFYKPKKSIVKTIALGDYYADFGQGLVFSNSFTMGKSIYFEQIFKAKNKISPYRSVNENGFLRGAAISLTKKNLSMTTFYSSKKIDAGLGISDTLNNIDENYVETIDEAGYHRTPTEIAKKNNLNEQLLGVNIRYDFRKIVIGGTFVHGIYDKNITPEKKIYSIYRFSGNKFTNAGIDYVFTYKKMLLYGEVATNGNSIATLHSIQFALSTALSFTTLYRFYPPEYNAPYSNAFRENTYNSNENGLFTGIRWEISRKLNVSAYYDMVVFPWLKYMTNKASVGNEILFQVTNRQNYKWTNHLRLRYKMSEKNYTLTDLPMHLIKPVDKYNIRYQLSYSPSASLNFFTNVEYCLSDEFQNKTYGFVSQQDISYYFYNTAITFRYALFTVSGYNSRIYAYEADVPGTFNSVMYYNTGCRMFLLLKSKILENLTVYFKISKTIYFSNVKLPVEITESQNYKYEIRLMIDYRF